MDSWEDIKFGNRVDDDLWHVFHENTKTGRYSEVSSSGAVLRWMNEVSETLDYPDYPCVSLPKNFQRPTASLHDAIIGRVSTRELAPTPVDLQTLSGILFYSCGVTRTNTDDGEYPRPFRTAPSGGALYPLEIYVHTGPSDGLSAGLYHYNPIRHELRLLKSRDCTSLFSRAVVQRELVESASLVFFITAIFERTTFKYGSKGYRFVLLEAGHVAQNMVLACTGYGLGSVNICGYFDREIDAFLQIDGVFHSTVYITAVGEARRAPLASRQREASIDSTTAQNP